MFYLFKNKKLIETIKIQSESIKQLEKDLKEKNELIHDYQLNKYKIESAIREKYEKIFSEQNERYSLVLAKSLIEGFVPYSQKYYVEENIKYRTVFDMPVDVFVDKCPKLSQAIYGEISKRMAKDVVC